MSIPSVGIYSDAQIPAGRTAEHHPAEYIRTRTAAAAIAFGVGVAMAVDGRVRTVATGDTTLHGVAAWSTQASDLDDGKYAEADPVGVMDIGVISVPTTEAVTIQSPVRVILTGADAGKFCTTAIPDATALVAGVEFAADSAAGQAALYVRPVAHTLTADVI